MQSDAKNTVKTKKNEGNKTIIINSIEGEYGWFSYTPSCLQCCNNPKGFLVAFSVFAIAAGTISAGVININVSALERRFRLNSSQSALIVIGYDIGFCLLAGIVTYFGSRHSRPRLISAGAAAFGLGCLIYALPHYISPLYNIGQSMLLVVCDRNKTFQPDCSSSNENFSYALPVLFIGTLFMGFGLTPLLTLGLAYIEDSVPKRSASVYLGIANACALVGPVIGFLGGGILLRDFYVDFDSTAPPINYRDPRWVGAWWILPLFAMGACWLVTIPLLGFPKQLPGTARNRAVRVSEVDKRGGSKVAEEGTFGKSVKDFPKSLWTLLKNPTFLLVSAAGCLQAVLINGTSAFLAKYIENAFHESLGNASLYAGAVVVPAGVVGNLIGGVVVYKFKWSTVGMLRFAAACMLSVAFTAPMFLLYCENTPVAGVTTPYTIGPKLSQNNLTSSCNDNCNCQEEFYVASCGSDGIQYFSPCQAGCVPNKNNPSTFNSCTCTNATVTIGLCKQQCTTRNAGLFLAFLAVLLTFSSFTPALLATMRCIPEPMRGFGIGIQFVFFRLLGTIPGPILFGAFIDAACMLWQTRQCDGSRGSCLIYNNRIMSLTFLTIVAIGNSLSALVYLLSACVYKPGDPTTLDTQNDWTSFSKNNDMEDKRDKSHLPVALENGGYVNDEVVDRL